MGSKIHGWYSKAGICRVSVRADVDSTIKDDRCWCTPTQLGTAESPTCHKIGKACSIRNSQHALYKTTNLSTKIFQCIFRVKNNTLFTFQTNIPRILFRNPIVTLLKARKKKDFVFWNQSVTAERCFSKLKCVREYDCCGGKVGRQPIVGNSGFAKQPIA